MNDQAYKIAAFQGSPRDWDFSGKSYRSYYVQFEGDDRRIEIAQYPETPAPNIGDTLTGHIEEQNRNGSFYYKFRKAKQGGGDSGSKSFRGKSSEELAQDRANSAVIRTYEYFLIPEDQRPTLRVYLETAAKIHTGLQRLASGQVVVEP